MKYTLELTGLEVFGYHGVLEHEKAYGQNFYFDCVYQVEASTEDEISATVSYASVAEIIAVTAKANTFDLIESLASACLSAVQSLDPRITFCKVTVHKPNAPIDYKFKDVAVSVTGGRFEN